MAQLATAPEINPTTLETHPTQKMIVKEQVQPINFIFDDISFFKDNKKFSIEQLDWVKLASKNKTIETFIWPINTITTWGSLSIDLNFVNRLIPVGQRINSYCQFTKLLISIKPTSNALMQGLSVITFFNSNDGNFVSNYTGVDVTGTNQRLWQLPGKKFVSPNNSNELNFLVPINFPFDYFKWHDAAAPSIANAQFKRHLNYRFGHLLIRTVVPLTTNSALTSLTYTVSASVVDLRTAGLQITNYT